MDMSTFWGELLYEWGYIYVSGGKGVIVSYKTRKSPEISGLFQSLL